MKKLLSICVLLALILSSVAFTGAIAETDTDDVFPLVYTGKEVITNPTTYCNPISITKGNSRLLRGGEPVITMFEDDYYLFLSHTKGYWWSHDFVDWTYVDAPNLRAGIVGVVNIDGKLYNYAGNTDNVVTTTDDPKSGEWYQVGTFSSNNYGDASMLYDEETGRLFMYYGWSQLLGIRVVELDKTTFKEISEPVVCIWGDPHNHGWETRYKADNIFPYFDHRDYRVQEYGWTEGGHPLKYNGKYYLLYSSIGLEFYSYGQGIYVADDPMGPYVYQEENPFTLKTTGVAPGGGHGSIFVDRDNNVWGVAMMPYALSGGRGDTLIALYPAGVDEDGVMHGKTEFGDYPQYLPGVVENPVEDNFTGWMLLSLNKKIEASSTLENCWTAHAVDEDAKTYWSAETGDAGEYITVDLGAVCDIRGIQILWDRAAGTTASRDALEQYQSFTIEVSDDNENWTLIVDKSNNGQDLRSDYFEMPTPVYARYVKLTNVFTPDDGKFAVKAFRVFGNPEESTWTMVDEANLKVVRSEEDRRYAHLLWDEVEGAEGYIIRYGVDPEKLYNSYMVYGKSYLDVPSLNVDNEYYWEVEAFSTNTPRYDENTFETQGRGVEFDLNKAADEEAGTEASTTRIMTYETYGRDEVYVFDNITPGTYSLRHTFGVGIWGPVELTEAELIGDSTEPTVVALDLTEFGLGSTEWGTVEVRVYPGETSGRIEVTLNYNDDIEADYQASLAAAE